MCIFNFLRNLLLIIAISLALPAEGATFSFTVSIDGLSLSGLGTCSDAPDGCTDLTNNPPGEDSNGPYDQLMLDPTGTLLYDNVSSPAILSISQTYTFVPGDTGAGSVD